MTRFIVHSGCCPFFKCRHGGGPDDARSVPKIFTFLEETRGCRDALEERVELAEVNFEDTPRPEE